MNIYYSPEKFGMRQIGEIDWSDGNYQFDLTVVWEDGDGSFWYAEDSGCSCPSPFENKGVGDLTLIESLGSFQTLLDQHDHRDGEWRGTEIVAFIEKLHAEGLR